MHAHMHTCTHADRRLATVDGISRLLKHLVVSSCGDASNLMLFRVPTGKGPYTSLSSLEARELEDALTNVQPGDERRFTVEYNRMVLEAVTATKDIRTKLHNEKRAAYEAERRAKKSKTLTNTHLDL